MNIYEKLLAVQTELKAPKGQYNAFGKYKYRSCEDIQEAVKPLLGKHKASIFIFDTLELIGDRYYVKATVNFVDCEKPEVPPIQVTAYAREEESKKGMDGSQVTGASSSYARKYALNGLFAIDDTKDSDATNTGNHNTPEPTPSRRTALKTDVGISEEARQEINARILKYKKLTGVEVKQILATVKEQVGFAVDSIKTAEQAKTIITLLDSMIREAQGKGA